VSNAVILDSTPLGLLLYPPGFGPADDCRKWIQRHLASGLRVCVPAIIAYEIRRELLRLKNIRSLNLLDAFIGAAPQRYIELTDNQLRHAAELWAELRRVGRPAADSLSLDIDVILAAQSLSLGLAASDFVVATSNIGHLGLMVPARRWQDI
jgi:predicted nucleic acid-binding protein